MTLKTWLINLALKGKLPKFFYVIAGRKIAKILDLKEGGVMAEEVESKKWYKSKGVLTGIVTILIGLYEAVAVSLAPQLGWTLPPIPAWIFSLLGAMGIYSRVVADKKIG